MPTSTAIKDYLLGPQFSRRLVRRYRRFEILSEGALRTAVVNLLRSTLRKIGGTAKGYRVTCETHLPDTNVVPDILIFRNGKPRIWIELKDTASFNRKAAEADWKKLKALCPKYPTVKAGYFIYVARRASQEFPIKRTLATLRFWAIPILLEYCMGSDFQEWNEKYKTLLTIGWRNIAITPATRIASFWPSVSPAPNSSALSATSALPRHQM